MSSIKEKQSPSLPQAGDSSSIRYQPEEDTVPTGTLHRRLNNRQIQLIAAGGSIGTALFISIGGGLAKGGAGNLLICYIFYSLILALVNNSIAEMSTYMPVAGGFIRLAGNWVDDALGFMAGWNFFLYEALLIPFEITALTSVIAFWDPDTLNPGPTAGVCAAVIAAYAFINVLAVGFYGEFEFWLSGGKIVLIFILFAFTFVTMCGGNPAHDAYGFRHFASGSFSTYLSTGPKGHFEGFLAALFSAGFTIVVPEYISMVSAEAQRPSIYIRNAFKTVYYRFCIFFVFGALAVGISSAHDDPKLTEIYFGSGGTGNAASSPYVIAMQNLGISGLPHVVNFLILTSIFSAGNTYTYAATRALYSLALAGRAPRFLTYCNRRGIPVWCFCVTMLFPFLSFLQCANGSAEVLNWLVSIVTGGALINFLVISITFINYYKACVAQGVDRKTRPYYGYFQPYGAYIALAVQTLIILTYGYYAFRPTWSTEIFFQNYSMQILAVVLFVGWKLVKRTRYVRPIEVDLVWERPEIDAYENSLTEPPTGFWEEMGHLIGIRRGKKTSQA
ncbi:amino acid permease/ SLC12A domain-containing protein [Fusarium redolens]|uniref:Amino acid permease/ SLC12A domain-containing protein n=1 Tax=Fusarium redolens TaxID=48865 RepID=A0A9P9JL69_FUSRE|nr:amino acid permease/ SLC12A domain-containing protein [Fusarium redolens]KAH7220483.1 amino acid permease/ SLC12A domain-containing protein [Fusarium redolens]